MELHCNVAVVKIGDKGNTAAAASAYISCTKTIGHDGRIHSYSNKPGFVADGFLLPDNAPERWRSDPTSMWAEQDLIDYTKSTRRGPNSELYRSGRIGLPWDISHERAAELADEMLEPLRKEGMAIQWAIHDVVENGKRNYHLHWMAAMREVTPEGFGKKCRAWNKYNGGLNIPELLRPHVANVLNSELQSLGSELKIEHENFADRGIDKIPELHMGPEATAMERKGIKTNKGRRNKYIQFLNEIHAENLRQAEKKIGSLEDMIAGAVAQRDGDEIYRDWDALFAALRDVRRSKAACRTEIGKLEKIISAYEESSEKSIGYLRWAGCDPENEAQNEEVKHMKQDLQLQIGQLDIAENLLLDSKEIFKAHNKVIYASKKVAWDEYQILKHKRSIEYQRMRHSRLWTYCSNIKNSMSIWDIVLNTRKYQMLKSMEKEQREIERKNKERLQAIKKSQKDLKQHQKDVRAAEHEEKKIVREFER